MIYMYIMIHIGTDMILLRAPFGNSANNTNMKIDSGKCLNFHDLALTFPDGASGAVKAKSCEHTGTSSDVLGNTYDFSTIKHDLT